MTAPTPHDHAERAPYPDPALGAAAIPTTPCDVCGIAFGPGDVWNYHARLGVYVHTTCAANFPVRGEDITTHTVLWGQIPDAAERVQGEVTAAVRREWRPSDDASPAVQRAAASMYIPASPAGEAAEWLHGWQLNAAQSALAAALDVAEMAAVIDPSTVEPMRSKVMAAWREHGLDAELYMADHEARATERATALRDAILGGAA